MRERIVAAASGAFWSGLVCALLGVTADAAISTLSVAGGAIALYFLVGWLLGMGFGALSGAPIPPLGVAFLFGGVFGLYPLNVHWLAGEPWAGAKSIAADCVLLSVFLLLAWLLRRWSLRPVPARRSFGVVGALVLAACLGTLFSGSGPRAPDREGSGPDILLLVLDSVRSDHVGFLGYQRNTSSPFDEYLPGARLYENGYSTASWTLPASLDILGVPGGSASASGFPASLAALGYATLLLTDNPHLSGPPADFLGFDEKRRSVPEWRFRLTGSVAGEILDRLRPGNDERLAERLQDWVLERKGPVYVHAHLMNAHAPFSLSPIDGRSRPGRTIEFPIRDQQMTEAERESIVARYDAGVRSSFAASRQMIETMRKKRQRPLLVLLTADHGELLGEGGQWFHGHGLEEELLRVPLLAWGTGVSPGRVEGLASNAQLPETILAAAKGDTTPRDLRASDGLEQVEGGEPGRAAFRIRNSYKVVVSSEHPTRLFRLSGAGTATDVTDEEGEMATLLSADLRISKAAQPSAPVDEATRKALESLGYIR